ncbi:MULTISPECIES: replicative DNA helicase [unclassified Helicobacter]|uniref:replicative DNA helicase n=1 Tax=unclassified Helicobacter TaxID=2593540 RepID=UPI000CF17A89|nr:MULTISPECIES: replicative DNA helicase [unclassified Helicobacter]
MEEISQSYYASLERTILASIIFDPSNFDDILDQLQPKDFSYPSHQNIFEVCMQLHQQDNPLDEEFIKNKMDKKLVSEEEFLYILGTNPIANIEAYIKELKNASLKRELHHLANVLREQSLSTEYSSSEILEIVEKKIYEISTQSVQSEFRHSKDIIYSTVERMKELKALGNQEVTGVSTGFDELNKVTTGFNKGDLIIIGARPGMGKTTLALNIVQNVLNHNRGVAFFSLEMPAEQLMLRMLSALTSIPLSDLKIGKLDDGQWGELSRATNLMIEKDFYVDDGSSLNISQLRSKLRKLKSKNPNIDIAFVDYLQLMHGGSKERHIEVGEISRGLKVLARELQIPIVALSQLNRSVETRDDKKPLLSDLRESGSIEQDADIILFVYREDVYREREKKQKIAKLEVDGKKEEARALKKEMADEFTKNNGIYPVELIVAKNRNGETKDVRIQFNKRFTRFENKASPKQSEVVYTPTRDNDLEDVTMPITID